MFLAERFLRLVGPKNTIVLEGRKGDWPGGLSARGGRRKALWNRYERQRSLLWQLMWSLTVVTRKTGASGPENFQSQARKGTFSTWGNSGIEPD